MNSTWLEAVDDEPHQAGCAVNKVRHFSLISTKMRYKFSPSEDFLNEYLNFIIERETSRKELSPYNFPW